MLSYFDVEVNVCSLILSSLHVEKCNAEKIEHTWTDGKKSNVPQECVHVLEDVTGNSGVCQKIRGSISLAIIPLNGEE